VLGTRNEPVRRAAADVPQTEAVLGAHFSSRNDGIRASIDTRLEHAINRVVSVPSKILPLRILSKLWPSVLGLPWERFTLKGTMPK
jgi:hypothetical protein